MITKFSTLHGIINLLDEAIEDLSEYGEHKSYCNYLVTRGTCTCGLQHTLSVLLQDYQFQVKILKDRFEHESD